MTITIIESNEAERNLTIEEVIEHKKIQILSRKDTWGSSKMDEQIVNWLEELISLKMKAKE